MEKVLVIALAALAAIAIFIILQAAQNNEIRADRDYAYDQCLRDENLLDFRLCDAIRHDEVPIPPEYTPPR